MITPYTCRISLVFLIFSISNFGLSTLYSQECKERIEMNSKGFFNKFHTKWILDYLQTFCECTPPEEIIEFAAEVKHKVEKYTHDRQHFSDTFRKVRKRMKKRHIKVDRHYFDNITKEIRKYGNYLKHTNKNDRPEINFEVMGMSQFEIMGTVACFCGVLLNEVPIDKADYISGIAFGIGIDHMLQYEYERDLVCD